MFLARKLNHKIINKSLNDAKLLKLNSYSLIPKNRFYQTSLKIPNNIYISNSHNNILQYGKIFSSANFNTSLISSKYFSSEVSQNNDDDHDDPHPNNSKSFTFSIELIFYCIILCFQHKKKINRNLIKGNVYQLLFLCLMYGQRFLLSQLVEVQHFQDLWNWLRLISYEMCL